MHEERDSVQATWGHRHRSITYNSSLALQMNMWNGRAHKGCEALTAGHKKKQKTCRYTAYDEM